MTTVTGMTADRMLSIEAASVVDGDVVGDNLILTKHDGSQINAGSVRGPAGPEGPVGQDLAVLTAAPILDVGISGQIRAGRQLTAADFTSMGLSAPVGLWNLSDLTDASGNGRNLLNKGNVPFDVGINGQANTAVRFSGLVSQALYIPDTGVNDPFRIKTGSIGCWFTAGRQGVNRVLLSKTIGYYLFVGSGTPWNVMAVFSPDGTTLSNIPGVSDVCDDRWHFAVATQDALLMKIYVDGLLENVVRASNSIFGSPGPINIGSRGADASNNGDISYNGRIDEVFVTADVLSEDQVYNLYCAKIPHTLAAAPTRVSLNVHRKIKGAGLTAADFPSQPLRLYNFSGGSLGDEGLNGITLTNPINAVNVAGPDGGAGNAYNFTQVGGHYLYSLPTGLPSGLNTRSYGCWFKTRGGDPTGERIMCWGNVDSTDDAGLGVGSTNCIFSWSGSDAMVGPVVIDGAWHHVVAVEDNSVTDGTKRKLYLDGKLVVASAIMNTINLGTGASNFRIGTRLNGIIFFTGQIDAVFVCNYALTQVQIAKLYSKSLMTLASSPKNSGDHIEAMNANNLLATFDTLEMQHTVDLLVA